MSRKKILTYLIPVVLFSSLIPVLLTFRPWTRQDQSVEAAAYRYPRKLPPGGPALTTAHAVVTGRYPTSVPGATRPCCLPRPL